MQSSVTTLYTKCCGQSLGIWSKSRCRPWCDGERRRRRDSFRFLKNEIDDLLSRDQILTYLFDIRTKVLWPDDNTRLIPMRNVKHRAYNACMTKIPSKRRFLFARLECNRSFLHEKQIGFSSLSGSRTSVGSLAMPFNAWVTKSWIGLSSRLRRSSFIAFFLLFRHLLCNFLDLLLEQLIPSVTTTDFLARYVHMHAGSRS